ncbi:bystin-like isoform X2 [Acropora millepora]|uniref:bystin-like isoform X2 n=1 Tax=Acropora millepora TaxID=45264 RepID=UPI001CF0F29B|nr:bystin-like isoform X2 [Acropora millepora]
MGKDKKARKRLAGLTEDILSSRTAKPSGRVKQRRERQGETDETYVEDKLSRKILEQARKQQNELEAEFGAGSSSRTSLKEPQTKLDVGELIGGTLESDDDNDDECDVASTTNEQFYENFEVNEEDEKAFQEFMSKDAPVRRTLADVILEKIQEKKTEIESQMSERTAGPQMDERLVQVFRGVGQIMGKYRSGKLPKAFKVVPSLINWEDVLYLTKPERWTAAAMFQGTRIFASNANEKISQRFFNLVLLPRVRDDIMEYKRLNYHLYLSRTCTLREAIIIGSLISKTSIPILHSSAAMLKIAEMDYSGANSIFLRNFFDKKYALPYRVIDAVVYHFLRFLSDKRDLPVLWHQSLLTFVQRYKEDISSEQKDAVMELCRVHVHSKITEEVRRELVHSKSREEEGGQAMDE